MAFLAHIEIELRQFHENPGIGGLMGSGLHKTVKIINRRLWWCSISRLKGAG
jgi:hypothetical protein